jgi:hypothetical protein
LLGFVSAVLGAMVCFVGAAAWLSALGRPHDVASGLLVVAGVVSGVGAVVLGVLAVRLGRRLGSGPPRARGSAGPARAHEVRPPTRAERRTSRIVGTVVLLGAVVAIVALGVTLHGRSARSSYTQSQGVAAAGVVTSVTSVGHDTRYDSWTSYDYRVELTEPVGDATSTVVHDPTRDFQRFETGERIDVLVDPQDTRYAELPGRPVQSGAWYVGPLVLSLVLLGLVALVATRSRGLRRARTAGPADGAGP